MKSRWRVRQALTGNVQFYGQRVECVRELGTLRGDSSSEAMAINNARRRTWPYSKGPSGMSRFSLDQRREPPHGGAWNFYPGVTPAGALEH
jgi:hypothetical protein